MHISQTLPPLLDLRAAYFNWKWFVTAHKQLWIQTIVKRGISKFALLRVPTQAIFSSFWQEKCLRKMQQTVLRSMGNVFQISASNSYFVSAIWICFRPTKSTCIVRCPGTWAFPLHSLNPLLLTLSLEKRRLSKVCPRTHNYTCRLTRGLVCEGLSKKASPGCQTAGGATRGVL